MKGRSNFWILLILALTLFYQLGYGQTINNVDSICWCADYKLQRSDFKGTPPKESIWNAISMISINVDGHRKGGIPTYDVFNVFDKQLSWMRDTSMLLLEHERLHFDIGEVYARKIRLTVDSLRMKGETKMSTYRASIDSLLQQWEAWGNAYDEETSHGLRPSKQEEWAIKIQKELSALEKYATKCPPNTH